MISYIYLILLFISITYQWKLPGMIPTDYADKQNVTEF